MSLQAQTTKSVMLGWDPSISVDVTNYNIYYGPASGVYTNSVSVGNVTNCTINELQAGFTYYFAATAQDSTGLESDFSNEISYTPTIKTNICVLDNWITSFNAGQLRSNYTGWLGLKFRTGIDPITLKSLGRIFINGNTNSHLIRLYDVANATILSEINWLPTTNSITNQIFYVTTPDPVYLETNTEYILASYEVTSNDTWYSYNTMITANSNSIPISPVYSSSGNSWTLYGSTGNYSYGPVSFQYCTLRKLPTPTNLRVLD